MARRPAAARRRRAARGGTPEVMSVSAQQPVWRRSYDAGVPAELEGSPLPLPAVLERSASRFGDSTAIIFMGRRVTYRALKRDVDRFAAALAALGVRKGTRVGIQLPNLPQSVVASYATLALGGQVVMTNPTYVEREIEHQWNDAGCDTVVVADYLYERRIKAIRGKLGVKDYIVASIPDYLPFLTRPFAKAKLRKTTPPTIADVRPGDGVYLMRDLLRGAPAAPPPVTLDVDDVALLQYTGGTTGVSKGAMLTHRNLSGNVMQVGSWFTAAAMGQDVFLSALPFFHVFGLTVGMNLPIALAAAMVIVPDPRDIRGIVAGIEKHRISVFPGVPAQFNSVNRFPGIERLDLTSVKACISGSAPLPRDVREKFEALTKAKIMEGFGLTETSPVTHANPLNGTRKDGSIGVPLPSTHAKIVSLDDGTAELSPGSQGELLIRGPQVMKGYWNQPEETSRVMVDGWLRTGDIATVDADGYFFIVGRKKEVIIAGGYKIFPDEIDDVLMRHPAVLEAGTIGVPDEKRGESVKSFVVLAAGKSATDKELVDYCRQQLAPYKVPREVEFRSALPKSGALKILRRELRDEELRKRAANPVSR
jgi:long-chain acyl-CoA synthetase